MDRLIVAIPLNFSTGNVENKILTHIPPKLLVQTKTQTRFVESNNMSQRGLFARFRRKSCVISCFFKMIDLMTMLYAAPHANKTIYIAIQLKLL